MSNAFALLGLPRTAALDPDALQQAWLTASRATHPDQPGGDAARAAEVNAAHQTLLAPEKRLKHLLDLHEVPWKAVPISEEMMTLFSRIGTALQSTASFLKRRQSAASALAKALLAPDEMRLREDLEALAVQIEADREKHLATLPALDTRLQSGDSTVLPDLQILQARLAYLSKWQQQLREALLSLM